eukprot:1309179-Prymnesium_polylepis.1
MRHHRQHTPVDHDRMRARCSLPTPPHASWAALPAATEGGAAEAAAEAAAEPPDELQARAATRPAHSRARSRVVSTDAFRAPRRPREPLDLRSML